MTFGTGIVYCCTFGDETDILWQTKYDLPVIIVISYNGFMTHNSHLVECLSRHAQKKIVEELSEKNLLVAEKTLTHRAIVHTKDLPHGAHRIFTGASMVH